MIGSVSNENPTKSPTGEPHQCDVLVVGAGIIGLAHAARAIERGMSVTVIDRDHRAVGASVRNFGHCCITAQSGHLYELAQAGRPLWLHYAREAGFWAVESGAIVVATTPTELAVLDELSTVREAGQVELLTAAEVAAELGREDTEGIIGGARLRDDLRVDPRTAVARLAEWVENQPSAAVRWNTSATGVGAGTTRTARVTTSRGAIEADQVYFCVGHDVDYLFPELAEDHRIERCSLNMARAAAPAGLDLGPAVLTASSMLRYQAFTEVPSAAALREEMDVHARGLLDIDANVMFTQRPDGSLLLGDSHRYARTQDPFLDEATSNTLHRPIGALLAGHDLEIIERWQGIYASSQRGPLLVSDVAEGITVVSVTSGVGMTVSFGLAETNTSRLPSRRELPARH